ncbi:MAG: PD-(D/E)XK nuclease family protein, partial [Clostridia bacterium]|nr:PD-(D/E)XK nuclease family protein [Clostridia bacterium]
LNTNRFFVYAAFSAPTDRLVLLCPNSELSGGELRPSTAWLSVLNMLTAVKSVHFDSKEMLYSRESIAANFPSFEKGKIKDEIEKTLLRTDTPYFKSEPMVSDKNSRIDFSQTSLNLSPSKFETYAKCPFSFFGNYLLDLKEKKQNEFSMPEIGNFVHKILELFMRECVSTGKFVCPSEHERRELVNRLSKQYFLDVIGKQASEDKKFLHTYANMVKTIDFVAENLCTEFSESDFLPVGFEFKIGLQDEDIPAITYDVNGKTVRLRGSIDRVDTYVQNGITYVRVIDYKTYAKNFSVDLVSYGLDSQLLHYLFAFCEKTGSVPAGAFYFTVSLPNVSINGRESEEELAKEIAKCIKRNGIVIDNPDVVYAMSNNFKFVPVKRNKEGNLYSYGSAKKAYTDEEFKEIEATLHEQINKLANNVFDGNMDVCPLEIENKTIEPCKYCSLGDLCRNRKQEEEEFDGDADYAD